MPHSSPRAIDDAFAPEQLREFVLRQIARPFVILSADTGEVLHASASFLGLLHSSLDEDVDDASRWMDALDARHRSRLLRAIRDDVSEPGLDCAIHLPDGRCRAMRFEIVRPDRSAIGTHDWVAITAEDISHVSQLQERSQRLQKHKSVLNELAIGLGRSTSLDYIYSCIHENVTQLMDAASFIVSLFDADTQTIHAGFVFAEGRVVDPSSLPPLPLGRPGEGTQSQVIRTGQPLNVPDLSMPLMDLEPQYELTTDGHVIDLSAADEDDAEQSTKSELLAPMLLEGEVLGVIALQSYHLDAYSAEDVELLCGIANLTAMAVHHVRLVQSLTDSAQRLDRALQETIEMVARTTEMRDPYTAAHQERVARLAVAIARQLKLSEPTAEGLRIAALLHDIGKLGIPYDILSKSAALSPAEYDMVKQHAHASAGALEGISFDAPVQDIVRQHHENIDGSGYPARLTGDEILIEARILRVADTVEAMTAHRPYRPAYPLHEALEELIAGAGSRYDGEMVKACLRVFSDGFEFNQDETET